MKQSSGGGGGDGGGLGRMCKYRSTEHIKDERIFCCSCYYLTFWVQNAAFQSSDPADDSLCR